MLCRERSCQLEILGRLVKENHWLPIKLVVRWSRKYVGGEKKVVRMGKICALTVRTAAAEYYCHLVFKKKLLTTQKLLSIPYCFYYICVQPSPRILKWLKIHRFLLLQLERELQHILDYHSDLIIRLVIIKITL